jgi:hypothetical protein
MTVQRALAIGGVVMVTQSANASRLVDIRAVDESYLMVTFDDSVVHYQDDGKGPNAFRTRDQGKDVLEKFGTPLDTEAAVRRTSYRLSSSDDPAYAKSPSPLQCFRRSKVNGTAWKWPDPELGMRHVIFLSLPYDLKAGKHYSLAIDGSTGSGTTRKAFLFAPASTASEAIHVNLIGYHPAQTKSADLYMWMGDGGARNYRPFVGRQVWVVDTKSGRREKVSKVAFWKPSGPDAGKWNLTGSPVWTCDFTSFKKPGTYRLMVDGVGCSPAFQIKPDIYFQPFKTSVRGFYYMRIGEPKGAMTPPPRQPRLIPGAGGLRVIRTTYGPWHPDWKKAGGDQWDNRDWSKYAETGEPTNPKAWGGHSDAADWDRNPAHISIIWDMLLPYLLTGKKVGNDDLGIPESGNGVPDLMDEARNEVDFWLRLRDGEGGYSAGLNNPSKNDTILYQAAASPYMAWANAANAAMLADCYRIAGKKDLMARYRDEALKAWKIAGGKGLDVEYSIGNGRTRGRDLKFMAAAFLYNVTGDRKFEDAMAAESVIRSGQSDTDDPAKYCQLWGTAAYLMCSAKHWRPIHFPALAANMKASVVSEATRKNVMPSTQRPSRRSTDESYGWFQTVEEVQRVCVAHAITGDSKFLRALTLEADYGLGRNPMNMVQMTGLGSRHPAYIYTSGSNDGIPESHPGHTPYMNAEPWGEGFMFDPKYYARRGYPAWERWPVGEALWNAPYCFANNEFTPQQTMRGKTCLLAYLYAMR